MFTIPHTFLDDDYIQNPILKRFCDDRKLDVPATRADLVQSFHNYASLNEANEKEALNWVLEVVKEGSKEFCFRRIFDLNPVLKNGDILKATLQEKYPSCPFATVVNYCNTHENQVINYKITKNEMGVVTKLSLERSLLVLEGDRNTQGRETIYPVFIDVYFDKGFIVSRGKAKSTIYYWTESKLLSNDNHISTKKHISSCMNEIIDCLGLTIESNEKIAKSYIHEMLYKLYDKYSFTPDDVKKQMDLVKSDSVNYAESIFAKLGISTTLLESAFRDMEIFTEKYISIDGNKDELFKKDRPAYLIKVVSDDEQDMTKVDTSSSLIKPLQCTEAFFDSKKSIIKNKKCGRIHLCFKRENSKYFGQNPFTVQLNAVSDYGYFKTGQYAEESDIEYVLQTIFENY